MLCSQKAEKALEFIESFFAFDYECFDDENLAAFGGDIFLDFFSQIGNGHGL